MKALVFLIIAAGCAGGADLPAITSPDSVPEWAQPGTYRAARWDGGPIEAEKGRLSGWPFFTDADERGVMAATRDWYDHRSIQFLQTAHINWAWVTWSVGFAQETEEKQWEQVRRYIAECHKNGIRVAAYFSIANMFWQDMFAHVPVSRDWVEHLPDGSPRFYKPPHRYMADISQAAWIEYTRSRVRPALAAGADAFWIDNTFAYHGQANVERLVAAVCDEAKRYGRKVVIMSNYNRGIYTWARLQNGVSTEDGQEPGFYPEEPEGKRLVTNAGLLRYQYGISAGWRPVSVEYGGRHRGERFTTPMEPEKWQLSIAECAAFQASLEPFFEGLFLRDLYFGEATARKKLDAIGVYNAFLERNQAYYRTVKSTARIALLAGENDRLVNTLNALSVVNLQYDVLFAYQNPTAQKLQPYRVVVVADAAADAPGIRETLAQYKRAGGTVTTLGDAHDLKRAVENEELATVDSPDTVLYNVVRQEQPRRVIVHLLNYTQQPVSGLTLRTRVAASEVRVISPDFDRERRLPIRWGECRLPELRTYSVLLIGGRQ